MDVEVVNKEYGFQICSLLRLPLYLFLSFHCANDKLKTEKEFWTYWTRITQILDLIFHVCRLGLFCHIICNRSKNLLSFLRPLYPNCLFFLYLSSLRYLIDCLAYQTFATYLKIYLSFIFSYHITNLILLEFLYQWGGIQVDTKSWLIDLLFFLTLINLLQVI